MKRSSESHPVGSSLAYLTGLRLVLNTAFRMVYPFLPVIARGLGVPLSQAGYLVSARWLAGMATPGVIATVGKGEVRRRVIVTGTAMFIVGALVTAATGVYIGALVGFALMGLAKPTYDVASQSYISDRVPYANRARYLAVYELAWAGSLLVGAPFAGWLRDRAWPPTCITSGEKKRRWSNCPRQPGDALQPPMGKQPAITSWLWKRLVFGPGSSPAPGWTPSGSKACP